MNQIPSPEFSTVEKLNMSDLVFRFDTSIRRTRTSPANCEEAIQRLENGNRAFAKLVFPDAVDPSFRQVLQFDADDLGVPMEDGTAPMQHPFAAVLGCSDARVPTELVLGQACNDLFVVRVAGNVAGQECLGSLDYALNNLGDSIKVVLVLGHSVCGAVSAAVDVFLQPTRYLDVASTHPLRAVVDRILAAVRVAAESLEEIHGRDVIRNPGYRVALIETSVPLNAAMTATTLTHELRDALTPDRQVLFGVYNLISRRVNLQLALDGRISVSLSPPPRNSAALQQLGLVLADGETVRAMLA
jgi:carbonic anhydrase